MLNLAGVRTTRSKANYHLSEEQAMLGMGHVLGGLGLLQVNSLHAGDGWSPGTAPSEQLPSSPLLPDLPLGSSRHQVCR